MAVALTALTVVFLMVTKVAAQKGGTATCELGRAPLDPFAIGKSISASGGCSPGGSTFSYTMSVEEWKTNGQISGAVVWRTRGLYPSEGPICGEDIVSAYRKKNQASVIYVRDAVPLSFFKTRAPKQYKFFHEELARGIHNSNIDWPCHLYPKRMVTRWGHKKEFERLLKTMANTAVHIRDQDCAVSYGAQPQQNFTRKEALALLKRHRIANAMISYLNGVAHSDFFCV